VAFYFGVLLRCIVVVAIGALGFRGLGLLDLWLLVAWRQALGGGGRPLLDRTRLSGIDFR
jgi:hypothetical protein